MFKKTVHFSKRISLFLLILAVLLVARYVVVAFVGPFEEAFPYDVQTSGPGYYGDSPEISIGARIVQVLDAVLIILLSCAVMAVLIALLAGLAAVIYSPFYLAGKLVREITQGTLNHMQVVLAAALSALAFADVIAVVFRMVMEAVHVLFGAVRNYFEKEIVTQLRCVSSPEAYYPETVGAPECLIQGIAGASRVLGDAGSRLLQSFAITEFNAVAIIVAFAMFVFLVWTLNKISQNFDEIGYFWLGYGGIAIFSIYLALSAILAVPLVTPDGGDGSGQGQSINLEEALVSAPVASGAPIAPLTEFLATRFTAITPDAVPVEGPVRKGDPSLQITVSSRRLVNFVPATDLDARLGEVLGAVSTLRARTTTELEAYRRAAIRRGGRGLSGPLGRKEGAEYAYALVDWYDHVRREITRELETCEKSVRSAKSMHAKIAVTMDNENTRVGGGVRYSEYLNGWKVTDELRALDISIRSAEWDCEGSGRTYGPPSRADFGSSLGIAGAATGWLLRTQNLQVAVITGLLGFGLLGALLSLFVRLQLDGGDGTTVASYIKKAGAVDMCVVVFTGFGAALVVYLASYGGLAIMATSNVSDPNPYVVFSAAFAGAVFSKNIWTRARVAMQKTEPDA